MDTFAKVLNELMVDTFQSIMLVEEEAIKQSGKIKLSIGEMHLLEAVGKSDDQGKTVSEVAQALHVSRPSATIAINKLEKKGYLEKRVSEQDGRVVHVTLTKKGKRIDRFHHLYHYNLVKMITNDLDEQEKQSLVKAVAKINDFFKGSIKNEK